MDDYVGKRLDGRYEIREPIGIGGMAVVYKAYDNIDDRTVAVKILKDEFLANEEFRRRFKNESKAIAVLSHPNIVKVYDVSFGDKLQYIVMEYIEGITLKEYIEQQKVINWKEALHFVIQILRALQHAHDKGIVHRDIKPQNIMLLQNGTIKVTDFGIARFSRGETRTMTESAIGSVHYISPEQARGEITDDKADLYSVGVVMYEMLTGTLPFQAESAVSVAIMQMQNEPEKPRTINPDIPIGLEQITLRAMQKSTRDRYQSAAEMLMDLEEFKRNPTMKFDYNFAVDTSPTQYVGTAKPQKEIVPPEQDAGEKADESPAKGNKHLIPILAGVVFSLILAFAIFAVIKVSQGGGISAFLGTRKIEVVSFIGKNYETDIKNNEEYKGKYNFEVQYQSNSAFESGTVFEQDPKSGEKISKGGTVKISVAGETTARQVPDVTGLTCAQAEYQIQMAGFSPVSFDTNETNGAADGTVVKTIPAALETAEYGSTVSIYIASASSSATISVPKLATVPLATARSMILACGLTVGEIKYENSSEVKDTVIGQSPEAGSTVTKDTPITLIVSNGEPVQNTATLKLTLPNAGKASLEVYINDTLKSEYSETIMTTGQSFTLTVTGSQPNCTVCIMLNNTKIYEAVVDFTKSPAAVSGVKNYNYTAKPKYTNVVGMELYAAKAMLEDAGFTNVEIKEKSSLGSEVGKVYEQDPAYSSNVSVNANDRIILYVSKIPPETDDASTTSGSTNSAN